MSVQAQDSQFVMPGLVPAIRGFATERVGRKTWMPGTRPGMTEKTA